jgi:uncharacterized iron-regulated membrane protein
MKLARSMLFWCHLAAGVCAGLVIAIMSATGAALALQPQILAWLERDVRRVEAPAGVVRLPVSQLLASAIARHPAGTPATVTVEHDPASAVLVSFGRDDVVYVNPYSGSVLGPGAPAARRAFQQITEWHRWLAVQGEGRATARSITGASNLVFLFLACSGLLLWIPRVWTRVRLRSILTVDLRARGKARDFNWHHAIGFWCAPVIVILTATGAVMSYPWANNLVYRLAGSPLPQQTGGPAGRQAGPGGSPSAARAAAVDYTSLDRALARAAEAMPTWRTVALRPPVRANGPVTLTLTDRAHWNAFARSQLAVQATGEVARWEPYAEQSAGQKARGWVRFGHTAELAAPSGQVVAGLASAGGVVLVWTGVSLALRRLVNWRRSSARVLKRAA